MAKTKRYGFRDWLIVKLGGITKRDWMLEHERKIIKTEMQIAKFSVTLDVVIPPGCEDVPPIVKERLAGKLADGLMESGSVHIEPYQINVVHTREDARHMRYVATLYVGRKEE